MPLWTVEPPFYLDMTSAGKNINPVRYPYTTDPFDSTYWDSIGLKATIMPWIPYFSNCEGYDSRIILFDIIEYNLNCVL